MTIQRKTWIIFFLFSSLSLLSWFRFTYPQCAFINLSIDRNQALTIAKNYLILEREEDLSQFINTAVFVSAIAPDQYLQRAISFEEELKFLKDHNFELFFWKVRFFRENEKEEFTITISAATGEITGFFHAIKEGEFRPNQEEETAKRKAIAFLKQKFGFNPDLYTLQSNLSKTYDNRIEYAFIWEKKDVFIHWSELKDTGGAKLFTGAIVTGDEILAFNKATLQIPNEFERYIASKEVVGSLLTLLFRICFFGLLTASVFVVVVHHNNLVMHTTKRFCLSITFCIFLLNILSYLNYFESVLFNYPTTSSISSYLWEGIPNFVLDTLLATVTILMPCLAGESLRYEVFPSKKESSFLPYITSTFFSRGVFKAIVLGYLICSIMIGIQTLAFEIGRRYLGVWIEHTWMTQLTSGYLPFLTAFIIGFNSSAIEEIAFRLFSINLGKKVLKNTFLAVLFSSVIWGYGHSNYPIFPMWFRGLEVTCLGMFLGGVYLRYGIIPVFVAHFLFDVFWCSSAHLLGRSTPYHFYSSLAVLLLPLFLAFIAYFVNQSEFERPLRWRLNKHQIFNLEILKHYLKGANFLGNYPEEKLKKEIFTHGWDMAVIDIALEELKKEKDQQKI